MLSRVLMCFLVMMCAMAGPAMAQKGPETELTQLPQDHAYQRVLRTYMATLTEADFDHGVDDIIPIDAKTSDDGEYLYRQYILTMMHQPLVGTKRGTPAITTPPKLYMLNQLESSKGVIPPHVWPETLIPFVEWDYPGNHYRNSRALKLRAFMGAGINMMMFQQFAESNDNKDPAPIRPDWHGYNAVFWAAAYPGFKDVLPEAVQQAYEAGMKMAGERMLSWGVRGESGEHDLMMPVSLIYIAQAIDDSEFTAAVKARTKLMFTDRTYFNSAGYWVERGGIDTGFGGTATLFAVWASLMTDWDFTKDTVARIYRLRSHLILPDPDGYDTGPSHFNGRLGSPASQDQFAFDGARDMAASMITDEAANAVSTVSPEALHNAPGRNAHDFNEHIGENPRDRTGHHLTDDEIQNVWPWKLRMWMTYNFPVSVNAAYSFYKKGAYAHRHAMEQANSPMMKSPYLRGENFVREFGDEFVTTRQTGYAAIMHVGEIGTQHADEKMAQFKGPMGLSGGELSAFWTPKTGSVLLGLRRGMSYDKSFDQISEWRTWPIHAVSGATTAGVFFTSARIQNPQRNIETTGLHSEVTAAGTIPGSVVGQDGAIAGSYAYDRKMNIDAKGIAVTTTIHGDGKDQIAELYETLPVYLRESRRQPETAITQIAFQKAGQWSPASDAYVADVTAVKLTRYDGAVLITFARPRRVKLSPAAWTDGWFTEAMSRTVLVDLMETGDKPATLKAARSVSYRIEPAAN